MNLLDRLQSRTGETDVELLSDLLETAGSAIMARRYPYGEWPVDGNGDPQMEARYRDLQVRIAIDLYNRIGSESQLSHSENGISRTYESSWISEQLLNEVTPYIGVVS